MEKYEKIRLVGRGAHGTVYLCNQKPDNKHVILKEIPVDQMTVDERQTSMNEAKVLAMLDHPNVVAYYDSFLEDKTMIIVMEYVQGGTLFDFLCSREGKLMPEEEILKYFGQMVYTLQHVHGKLILHRDLKSQNILLNEKQNVIKIGDFGISKVLTSKSKAYTVVGTPCYISPELCEGKPYNQKSDIWALGCVLYELMTLKRPFDAATLPALIMKIMKGSFDPVPNIYSLELRKLLSSMLNLDSNQRPTAAQIMCNPVMIKVIFKLYLEIGSIPLSNKSPRKTKNLKVEEKEYLSSSSYSSMGEKRRSFSCIGSPVSPYLWYFEKDKDTYSLLPTLPKNVVICAALSESKKIGITDNGFLMTWKNRPELLVSNISETDFQEKVVASSIIPCIIDERVAINIISVVCGQNFTICLSNNGVVFSFGKASSGCLGYTTERDIEQPKIIDKLFNFNIRDISCGPKHVLALSDENELFSWGHGDHGCLSSDTTDLKLLPELVTISSEIKPEKIFCGMDCSFIILADMSVMACGSNRHNKLAMDTGEGFPVENVHLFTLIASEPLSCQKITSISSGKSHSAFLTETNELYSVGSNRHFQLGWGNSALDYSMPQRIEKLSGIKLLSVNCANSYTLAVCNVAPSLTKNTSSPQTRHSLV
nr:serine/threonine-protein kinase Nek8 isoform X2 [Parasteatoda tepidariorum]